MIARIAGIVFVFLATSFAWVVLGATVGVRTASQDTSIRGEVGQLWGVPQRQKAPAVSYALPVPPSSANAIGSGPAPVARAEVPLESSDVDVDLGLEYRQKGLLWYSTYRVRFSGEYVVANHTDATRDFDVAFAFPAAGAIYDNFRLAVGGKEVGDLAVSESSVTTKVRLAPGASERVSVSYGSQGLDDWWYDFGSSVSQVKNLRLAVHTNFDEIDFPPNAISPVSKTRREAGTVGWDLVWQYSNLLSGVQVGVAMPKRLNPGPWVSQITFFGPVSLFFFFFLLFMISTIRRVPIHPMNYFFIGTGFFSFHLLLAYLVDHVSIHAAFAVCSVVSMFLVISYMRLVAGFRFAVFEVGVAQFVYLVLFGYTFFFEKYTGLAITIMSIVTLFVVMQATGRIDWSRIGEPATNPAAADEPTLRPPASVAS